MPTLFFSDVSGLVGKSLPEFWSETVLELAVQLAGLCAAIIQIAALVFENGKNEDHSKKKAMITELWENTFGVPKTVVFVTVNRTT